MRDRIVKCIIPGKQRNASSSENDFHGGRPDLEQLSVASVRTLSTDDYSPSQIESALTHLFGIAAQLIADGAYYGAESDGRIVGSGGWSKRQTLFGRDRYKAVTDSELGYTVTQHVETRFIDGAVLPMVRREKTAGRPAAPQSTPAEAAAETAPGSKSARTDDGSGQRSANPL